jgi:hypothetical protein
VVAQHTPGPWETKPVPKTDVVEIDIVAGGTSARRGGRIARVFGGTSGCGAAENAVLIAAAPDLLAFLKRILDVATDPKARSVGMTVRGLASYAIAKAEGRA